MTPLEQYDAAMQLRNAGKEAEAKHALEQIADFALACNALAAIEKKAGDIDKAVGYMQKYTQLEPDDAFGYSVLSAYAVEAGNHEIAETALGKASELRFAAQFG